MLEGLDRIDWSKLHHAYGPASDVPGQLRALASAEAQTREEALYELFGNIWHQGTVYEASAHTVPFLIELLREPSVEGKVGILNLLECLATGNSHLDVHARGNHEISRKMRDRTDFDQTLALELSWVRETHAAVLAGIPVYLERLGSEEWDVRLAAAKVLTTCVEHRDIVGTNLLHCFERETDPRVHFGLLLCLGEVGRREDADFLKAIVGAEPDPRSRLAAGESPSPGFLRWAAAVALARILGRDTPIEAIRILEETFANPEPADEFLQQMPWDHEDAIEAACSVLRLLPAEKAVPILIAASGTVEKRRAQDILWELLNLTFPEIDSYTVTSPHEPRTPVSLAPLQREVLETLITRDEAWEPSWGIQGSLKCLGLPDRKEELRAFLRASPS
jgi:hypothetical protein